MQITYYPKGTIYKRGFWFRADGEGIRFAYIGARLVLNRGWFV